MSSSAKTDKKDPLAVTNSIAAVGVGFGGDILFEKGLQKGLQKIMTASAAGPAVLISFIVTITTILLDMLWNPLKNYFNNDLKDIKETIDSTLKIQFAKNGFGYPLEIKPNVLPETEEDLIEFKNHVIQYYTDNGLISSEDVLEEENLYTELNKLIRYQRTTINPFASNLNLLSGTQQNLLIIAASLAAKKRNEYSKKAINIDPQTYKFKKSKYFTDWVETNYQLIFIILTIIILTISLIIV